MSSKSAHLYDDLSGIQQVGESILRRAAHAEHTSVQITPYEKHSLIHFYRGEIPSSPITIPHGLHQQIRSYLKHLITKDSASKVHDESAEFKTFIDHEHYILQTETSPTPFGRATLIRIKPQENQALSL